MTTRTTTRRTPVHTMGRTPVLTMGRTMRRAAVAIAAVATATAMLAACGPGGEPAASTPTATQTETPTPTPTPTETVPAFAADDPACLVGEWELDQAALTAFYDDINALGGGSGMVFTPEGRAGLLIAEDGTFVWAPDAVVTARVESLEVAVTLGGNISGTYTTGPGTIATDTVSTDALEVSASVDDAPFDAAPIIAEIGAAPITDATFVCTGETLTLETAIADGSATTTLQRR